MYADVRENYPGGAEELEMKLKQSDISTKRMTVYRFCRPQKRLSPKVHKALLPILRVETSLNIHLYHKDRC